MIIDRYLSKEVTTTLVGVVVVMFMIFMTAQLVGLLSQVNSGGLQLKSVMLMLGLKVVGNFVFLMPLSVYLAVLITFGRLYRDNEMVVLAACGISQLRLLRTVFLLGLFYATLVGAVALVVAPWAEVQAQRMLTAGEHTVGIESFAAGRFRETLNGDGVLYVEEVNAETNQLTNLFIQQSSPEGKSIITARTGYYQENPVTGARYLILEDGYRNEGEPGGEGYAIIRFSKHAVLLNSPQVIAGPTRPMQVSTSELLQSHNLNYQAELQWRVSSFLLCLILTIMALPLSQTSSRQGRYGRLGIAMVIYIIYGNLLSIARVWVERGEINPHLGIWVVHLVFLVVTMIIYIQPKIYSRLLGR